MSRIPTTVAAVPVGALLLVGCGGEGAGEQASGLAGFTRDPVPRVGGVSLPGVGPGGRGKPVPMRAKPGNLLVVYFGFASCPDVCPTTLSDVRGALKRLPADQRKRVEVAMVTVDPTRDTANVMRSYVVDDQGRLLV
ncbi:MAG: SCO family protein [Actinomycetota bacterium]|nr:SCO family protein [Actinomycetota bacterium]